MALSAALLHSAISPGLLVLSAGSLGLSAGSLPMRTRQGTPVLCIRGVKRLGLQKLLLVFGYSVSCLHLFWCPRTEAQGTEAQGFSDQVKRRPPPPDDWDPIPGKGHVGELCNYTVEWGKGAVTLFCVEQ